jgi:hypothetical protein
MNGTILTTEKLAEIIKLLQQADDAIIRNVYAKNKIKESIKLLKNEKTNPTN